MSIVKILNENNVFYDITGKTKYPLDAYSKMNKYLTGLRELKKDIKESDNPDKFLSVFDNKPCDKCIENKSLCNKNKYFVDHDSAVKRLYTFHNGIYGIILDKLSELDFDILLAGSSGIASVIKKTDTMKGFEPKDMDIYVTNINDSKITQINEKIKEIFPTTTYTIIVVRRILTLTWWIFDNTDTNNIMEIQLNMLTAKSWTEFFIVYHTDLVCVGYDIKKKQFITQTNRWNNFVNNFPTAYITNLNSHDQPATLEMARVKYINRGFNMMALTVYNKMEDKNIKTDKNNDTNEYGLSGPNSNNHSKTEKNLINKLTSVYNACSDIIISDDIVHLYDKIKSVPPIIDVTEIDKETEFNRFVVDFQYPNGVECPIIFEKNHIMLANLNCMHDFSLKSYILMKKFDKCPLCRKQFMPIMYNIIKTKKSDAIEKYKTINKTEKYKISHVNNFDEYFNKQHGKKIKFEDEIEDEDVIEIKTDDEDDIGITEVDESIEDMEKIVDDYNKNYTNSLGYNNVTEEEEISWHNEHVSWNTGTAISWDTSVKNDSSTLTISTTETNQYEVEDIDIEIEDEIDVEQEDKPASINKPMPVLDYTNMHPKSMTHRNLSHEENIVEQAEAAWTEVKPRRNKHKNNKNKSAKKPLTN